MFLGLWIVVVVRCVDFRLMLMCKKLHYENKYDVIIWIILLNQPNNLRCINSYDSNDDINMLSSYWAIPKISESVR